LTNCLEDAKASSAGVGAVELTRENGFWR